MHNFTAHRLHFITEVQTPIALNEHQGSAIRGAFFHAMRRKFCAFARDRDMNCERCALAATCPVATLVSTLAPGHPRGQNRPRPYTIQPPLPGSGHPFEHPDGHVTFHYDPGETLRFGLTLYADAMALFPYVVLATAEFEESGLGIRLTQVDGHRRRGTLSVQAVWAENPLTDERQPVVREGSRQVQVPDIPITHAQIRAYNRERDTWMLRFLTPTRLIEDSRLVKPDQFRFRPLFHRLLDRLEALSGYFSDTRLDVDFPALLEAAEAVRVLENRLSWEELRSYSTRRRAASPTSGLIGSVVLQTGDWSPFLPWLLWGQFTHVGKDSVKGNGWYKLQDFSQDEQA